jgi:hypothetical protein
MGIGSVGLLWPLGLVPFMPLLFTSLPLWGRGMDGSILVCILPHHLSTRVVVRIVS